MQRRPNSARRSQAHRATARSNERARVLVGLAAAAVFVALIGVRVGGEALAGAFGSASSSRSSAAGSADAPAQAGVVGVAVTPAPSDPTVASSVPPSPTPGASGAGAGGGPAAGRFPGGLLIADRGNGRLLVVTDTGRIAWSFPRPGSLPRGQLFSADDAFLAPDGKTIVANDEAHQVIDRIDIATRRIVWQYGAYNRPGSGPGQLHTPDDAYPLANGNIVTADIRNCRILEIAPDKHIVHQWGRTGVCVHRPPFTFSQPNGDTPLPDGGLLITEITGSRIVRLSATGKVVFDIHAPVVYPSDAQLAADGSIVVADYATPGAIVRLSPSGRLLWRYEPRSGGRALDHPSLAVPLGDGSIVANDDGRDRVVVIDPATDRIVWQYGVTGQSGRSAGHLSDPDGLAVLPPGTIPGLG